MSIRISDPLFLLSAETGLSAAELIAEPGEGNTEFDTPQASLQTGEPIPVVFCRRRNNNGGVMIKPKATEAFFFQPDSLQDILNIRSRSNGGSDLRRGHS